MRPSSRSALASSLDFDDADKLLQDRRGRDGVRGNRCGQMKQIVPVIKDQCGVDRRADMVRQRRVGIGFLEGVELPVLEVAQSRREALADQGEQPKDMIAGAAGIGEELLDLEDCVVIEQSVEHIDGLAFGRADRQNAEVAVLIGKCAVELRSRLAAIVEIDISALGGPVACPEELAIR